MSLSRDVEHKVAYAVLNLDSSPSAEVIAELENYPDILTARELNV